MQTTPGNHLFTFAVISDSHVNEAEDRSASPYPCNRLANGRFRHAVHSLNRHRPAFTVHLGDMANPVPGLSTYAAAADAFHALAAELRSPLHVIPGNHCVGDKPTGWVPVPRVDAETLEGYSQIYGKHWYSLRRGPCHFIAFDSLLINSGLPAEARQRRWVEKELTRTAGRRLWLFMHYPPYIASPDELGSYDNVDEPGRSWLLGLFERFEIEAAYTGHVHNYFYNRYAGSPIYTVPALSFVRQDYSELYSVAPDDGEGGRNDVAKLGYFLVDVYERGHRNRLMRTYGESLPPDTPLEDAETAPAVPPDGGWSGLGVEMRESWLSTVALRTNNSVNPFTRRRARNDWAVLALQEMGLSKVRLPLPELAAADVVERMATLQGAGFEFVVYSHGIPDERSDRLIREHRALIAGWELILDLAEIGPAARRIAGIVGRGSGDLPCFLNPLRNVLVAGKGVRPAVATDGANVKHEANYGFHSTDLELATKLAGDDTVRSVFRGFVFRNRRRGEPSPPPWTAIRQVDELGRASGLRHQLHLLFSGHLTAERMEDDRDTANRVAEAALATHLAAGVELCFDTFEDIDRGYFVRHGLVDRRYNPRPAAGVLKHLRTAVAGTAPGEITDWTPADSAEGRLISTVSEGRWQALLLPRESCTLDELPAAFDSDSGSVLRIDLADGTATPIAATADGARVRFAEAQTFDGPALLISGDRGRAVAPPGGRGKG